MCTGHSREVATAESAGLRAGCHCAASTGDNWRKRRWLQREKETMTATGDVGRPNTDTSTPSSLVLAADPSARHPLLHLKKRQKQKERARHTAVSSTGFLANEIGEAAKQFCKDCRDAARVFMIYLLVKESVPCGC